MSRKISQNALCATSLLVPALFVATFASAQRTSLPMHEQEPVISAQPHESVISLAPEAQARAAMAVRAPGEVSFENAPASFHAFASARVGEDAGAEQLTLNFTAATKLTHIESKNSDFVVESGGTCHEGNSYSAGESCTLMVSFRPQGAGRRLGRITIENTAEATPFALGIGGYGYAPVLSFNPALITTVPNTYVSSKGVFSGAQNIAVDGSDAVYISDTGNNAVKYITSTGTVSTIASGYTSPLGVAVDSFGEVYFDLNGSNLMYEIYDYGPIVQITGTTTGACPASTPCTLSSHVLSGPGAMSFDANNNLFFTDRDSGAAWVTAQPVPAKLVYLYDPFPYQTSPASPIVVDTGDNLYSVWATSGDCEILQSSLYNAENSNVDFNKVAGVRACGFSGDGGQAGNAEIGSKIGQMAFDIAGNLYFTDTANQRVRRIDYVTGQINTIAGNGTAGYTGDNSSGTLATLSSPTGVAVDSQGQVYILSNAPSAGPTQVLRKLGPNGFLNFGGELKGTTTAAKTITISNTGNSAMTLTSTAWTGANAADFSLNPATTSCMLTAGSTLNAGQSCRIGFTFKPSASGSRTANFVLLNNTVTSSNTIQLAGIGTLPAPTFTITSPANGTSVTTGTAVTFSAKVSSTTTPAPTGTVTFKVNSTQVGSPVTIASGIASTTVTETAAGTYTLSATYSGDANYAAAGPVTVSLTVTAAAKVPAKVALTSAPSPMLSCAAAPEFLISVTGMGSKPTGTVELKAGATVLASGMLNNGAAALSAHVQKAGKYSLTASYSGDSTHEAAISAAMIQMIAPAGALCGGIHPIPARPGRIPLEMQ